MLVNGLAAVSPEKRLVASRGGDGAAAADEATGDETDLGFTARAREGDGSSCNAPGRFSGDTGAMLLTSMAWDPMRRCELSPSLCEKEKNGGG